MYLGVTIYNVENVANGTIDYKTIENNILPKTETEIIEEQNKINEPFSINGDISSLTDKQKILLKEFENYSNNSDKSHQLYNVIDGLQRMNDTQQYHITTTEEMAKMEGINLVKNEDGKYELNNKPYIPRGFNYKNGEIYINLDAGEVSGTQAVYHEIFEGFKKSSPETYDSLKTMVQDIIGKEYDTELTKYTEMYGSELANSIEDEFLNDKFGEIAESNNFIKKIVDDRNVFEKFIDKLKNAIKYITSDKEQRKLIRLKNKLENEFSKRYKETNFNNNSESNIALSLKNEYNDINEEMPDDLIPYVSIDERKAKFIPYSKSESFFELDYERMDKAIAIGSRYALEAQQQGYNSYSFNDEKYTYDFDIINKNDNAFRITNAEIIKNISEVVADETNPNSSSKYSLDNSKYEKTFSDINNKSVEKRISSNENVRIPSKEQKQLGFNESRQFTENKKKNSRRELENSSFSLEQRVSGDDLLDAQDLIEEIKSIGANVDKNGYVTLYHQTTNENANKIKQTGKMIAKEPYVYFSTSKDASQSDGRGNTKLEFKIPAEKLILDNIFSDNADVKIKLNSNKELDVSNYINNKNQDLEKYIFDDDFYEQFKYESKDKITKSIEELQKELETVDDSTDEGWSKGYNIRQNIRALQNGYDNQYDYIVGKEKDRLTEQYKNGFLDKKIQEKIKLENKAKQLEEDIKTSSKFKNAQFEIIQEKTK